MGFKIVLTIRHIRGKAFEVECARDADTLGIKVLIWESQRIPIDKQRLIFSGREMDDSATLTELEIVDGTTIFLVEAGAASDSEGIPAESVQPMAHVPPAFISPTQVNVNMTSVIPKVPALHSNVPAPHAYAYLDEESAGEERISQVVLLSKWVRKYFLLGMILSLFGIFRCVSGGCLFGGIFMLSIFGVFLIGFVAGRRLQRCLLIVPALLVGMIGFFGFFAMTYTWLAYVHSAWMLLPILITIMHVVIFACICRLMTRIGQLTNTQFGQARARIQKLCCLC
jgi:hypothetical protein